MRLLTTCSEKRMTILKEQIRNPRGFLVEHLTSPNKTSRLLRPLIKPQVALMHHTATPGIDSPKNWFLDPKSRVSADFMIGKDGRILRMVPKGYAAWHAGMCTFEGKVVRNYNFIAYGIELVNRGDGRDPYPAVQLEAMAYVFALIQFEAHTVIYPRRHEDVAYPPGRKTDPAGLPQSMIYAAIHQHQPFVKLG